MTVPSAAATVPTNVRSPPTRTGTRSSIVCCPHYEKGDRTNAIRESRGGSRVAKSGRWMVTATCHPPQALTIRLRANPADGGRTRPSMRWWQRDAPVNRGLHRQPHAEPVALIYIEFGALALVASRNRGSRVATPCDIVRLLHRGAAR